MPFEPGLIGIMDYKKLIKGSIQISGTAMVALENLDNMQNAQKKRENSETMLQELPASSYFLIAINLVTIVILIWSIGLYEILCHGIWVNLFLFNQMHVYQTFHPGQFFLFTFFFLALILNFNWKF